jgi:hypothetical protein
MSTEEKKAVTGKSSSAAQPPATPRKREVPRNIQILVANTPTKELRLLKTVCERELNKRAAEEEDLFVEDDE